VTPARLLLAEDDDDLREVLRTFLESAGLEVHTVASGFQLLDVLAGEELSYDLVISDVRMPGLSGLQVAVTMRKAGYDTPLIVMSAFGSAELRRTVEQLGNAVFLNKPVEPAELVAHARQALARGA
jgi:DNA-binding response OmpR family regulator